MINGYVNIPEHINELFVDIPESSEPGAYTRTSFTKELYDEVDKLVHANKIPYFDFVAPRGRVFGPGIAAEVEGQLLITMTAGVISAGVLAVKSEGESGDRDHLVNAFVRYD